METLKSLNREKDDLYWFFGKGLITELDYLKTLDKINDDIININKENKNGKKQNNANRNS